MSGHGRRGKGPCRQRRRRGMRILLRPIILLMLAEKESHGYELYEQLQTFGFDQECLDTSVLYRDLREMEELGLIGSEWDTEESKGPQRRVYRILPEGFVNLDEWIEVLSGLLGRINQVVDKYAIYKETSQ